MVIGLTTEVHDRIAAAIAAQETRTSGEIFCVLARQVSSYRDVSLGWAAAAALILPLGLIPLGFDPAWIPGMADSWETGHLASRNVSVAQALSAYAVIQAVVFLTVYLLTRAPAVRRWIAPLPVRRARVRDAAVRQFLAHGLHVTKERTGVLIFAALGDHLVEVVADESIHSRVDPTIWGDAVAALSEGLKAGDPAAGFEAAIALCGDVLAAHFPPRPVNPDELPNRLVVL